MAKRKLKAGSKLATFLFFTILAVIITFYIVGPKRLSNDKNKPNPQVTSYFIDKNVPKRFATEAERILADLKWKATTDKTAADFLVVLGIPQKSKEITVSYFQVWVPTRKFATLASSDFSIIYSISDLVDYSDLSKILPQTYTVNTEAKSGATLRTIQELNGTEIAQKFSGKTFYDKNWWTNKNYPLIETVSLSASQKNLDKFTTELTKSDFIAKNNYMTALPKPTDFIKTIKTGTSVIGGPGWATCQRRGGFTYPIQQVRDYMRTGDHVIISNESSFVSGCSQAPGTTAFCGAPKQLENLLSIKGDIISLTGNHMADYGRTYFSNTLDIYKQNHLPYYGAGKNSTEAWKPLYMNMPAGKVAFIGVNKMGPPGVLATKSLTGTASYESARFKRVIAEARQNADIVWVDTQLWPEYGTTPGGDQTSVSYAAIDSGADIVTGVSSHEAMGIQFYKGKPIFYGLGNFLFDQMWSLESRQGLVLEVALYNKKIINIEVLPTMTYDYCQPRIMTGSEKTRILKYIVGISKF